MPVIVVGGSNKGVGKTALVCGLIAALSEFRWTAVKITSHDHESPQPIWEETTPGLGTDTARYLAAGAHRSFLATPPLNGDPPAQDFPYLLSELRPHLAPGASLIYESNSIVEHVLPDLCLMVLGLTDRAKGLPAFASFKHSYLEAVHHADALVIHSDADGVAQDAMQPSNRPPGPIFYLASFENISAQMLVWVRDRLPASA
jgi:hypothetical protein